MRALIFTTGTADTIKLVNSFTSLGHEYCIVQYDVPGLSIETMARQYGPEIIIYIGAIKAIHHSPVPDTAELCRTNAIAPMVHICSDPADDPWWPSLEEYDAAGAFRLQVGIDGSRDNPISRFGMMALTPVDPKPFPDPPWDSRTIACGFAGGVGFRESTIGPIRAAGLLTHFGNGGHAAQYEELCRFYATCRTVVNDNRTGTGRRRHVKGRFVEAALGGAVVIEQHDSPAATWFEEGADYLVWHTPQEAIEMIHRGAPDGERYESMARRLRAKMLEHHAGPVFWRKVLERMGL
jgi:Glycosyl transferases group 1